MSVAGDKFQIDAPHLLSRRRRVSDAVVTGLVWILYSYLWAPLISLLAWLLGFEFAYDVMVRAGGINTLEDVLFLYGIVVASIFVVVATWSTLNRRRFANHDRRQSGNDVSDSELAGYFALDDETLQKIRSGLVLTVSVNDAGGIDRVDAAQG